jgi:hypothetical protein
MFKKLKTKLTLWFYFLKNYIAHFFQVSPPATKNNKTKACALVLFFCVGTWSPSIDFKNNEENLMRVTSSLMSQPKNFFKHIDTKVFD